MTDFENIKRMLDATNMEFVVIKENGCNTDVINTKSEIDFYFNKDHSLDFIDNSRTIEFHE